MSLTFPHVVDFSPLASNQWKMWLVNCIDFHTFKLNTTLKTYKSTICNAQILTNLPLVYSSKQKKGKIKLKLKFFASST